MPSTKSIQSLFKGRTIKSEVVSKASKRKPDPVRDIPPQPHSHSEYSDKFHTHSEEPLKRLTKGILDSIDSLRNYVNALVSTEISKLRNRIDGIDTSTDPKIIRRIEALENRPTSVRLGGGGIGVDRSRWRELIGGANTTLHSHSHSGESTSFTISDITYTFVDGILISVSGAGLTDEGGTLITDEGGTVITDESGGGL